jgi:hypothetical protein
LPGLRLVPRGGHLIGSHEQSDSIRNWLEQLRVRPGIQNISCFLSPRRFHRAYGYKGGNCAHKASSLLIHVHLRGKILTNAQRLRWLEVSALMAKINGEN